MRSRFLIGNYRPVEDRRRVDGLAIDGAWPQHLQGTLVLAGPNPVAEPATAYVPLEGNGMVHAVRVEGDRARYWNRYVETPDLVRERAARRLLAPSMGDAPDVRVLREGRYPYRDAANALVVEHAGKVHVLGGMHDATELDPDTLETVGPSGLGVGGGRPFGAHTKHDPRTGQLVYFRAFVDPPAVAVGAIDARGAPVREATFALSRGRLMHDFAITRRYAVILDVGPVFDEPRALAGLSGWWDDPRSPARVGLVARDGVGGEPLWFPVEPCAVIHTLNAWESDDGRRVTLLAVGYPGTPEMLRLGPPAPGDPPPSESSNRGRLCQWVLEVDTGRASMRKLAAIPCEFPRLNDAFLGRESRHAWAVPALPRSSLLHFDAATGVMHERSLGKGRYASEVVFVARPGGEGEDDGHLLGFVWDSSRGCSEVVVLDARDDLAPPVARIALPLRVPFGFHVTWLPRKPAPRPSRGPGRPAEPGQGRTVSAGPDRRAPRRVAVVGAGVAGLAAAAFLQRRHHVVLFERERRLGGHAHTLDVDDGEGGRVGVDVAFMVLNPASYPRFMQLLAAHGGVELGPSEMSFSYGDRATGTSYVLNLDPGAPNGARALHGSGLAPLLGEIARFMRRATRDLDGGEAAGLTLREWLDQTGCSAALRERYVLPLGAALWSCPLGTVERFPADSYLRFFRHHGMLSLEGTPGWQHVRGGSRRYVEAIVTRFEGTVRAGAPVEQVRCDVDGAWLTVAGCPPERFDDVVLATHADQALRILADADDQERAFLGSFAYQSNRAVLHVDRTVMPERREHWASWNLQRRAARDADVCVTYHLNRLQGLGRCARDWFVTLHPDAPVADRAVVAELRFEHPVMDARAVSAQARAPAVSGRRRVHFAGAYLGYGFHEDGVRSAVDVARALGVEA